MHRRVLVRAAAVGGVAAAAAVPLALLSQAQSPTPASSPPDVPDLASLRLRRVVCVFRHGERTPLAQGVCGLDDPVFDAAVWRVRPEDKLPPLHITTEEGAPRPDAPKNQQQIDTVLRGGCSMGELTTKGRESAVKLGLELRDRYIHGALLLPRELASTHPLTPLLHVRSTNVERTLETARGVLFGLFGLATTHYPVRVLTMPEGDESMHPNVFRCGLLRSLFRDARNLFHLHPSVDAHKRDLATLLGCNPNKLHYLHLRDIHVSAQSHSLTVTPSLPPHVVEQIDELATREVMALLSHSVQDTPLGLLLSVSPLVTEIMDSLHVPTPSQPPMVLLSGHDTTVLPLLSFLEHHAVCWPPFCSHLCFEIYTHKTTNEAFVRILHDFQPLVLPPTNQPLVALDTFRAFCSRAILPEHDFDKLCGGDHAAQAAFSGTSFADNASSAK